MIANKNQFMKTANIQLSISLSYFIFALLFNATTLENISVLTQMTYDYKIGTKTVNALPVFQIVAFILVAIFVAPFVKKISYKKIQTILLSSAFVACCLIPLVKSFWIALFLFLLTGASLAYIRLVAYHFINEVTESKHMKASLLLRLESMPLIGFALGIILFGIIGKVFTEWYNVYWFVAILIAINLCILLLEKQPEIIKKKALELNVKSFFSKGISDFIQISSHTLIQMFVISSLFLFFTEAQIHNWAFEFTKNALKSNGNLKVQLFFAILITSFVSRLVTSYVILYIRPFWLLTILLVITLSLVLIITGITWQTNNVPVENWYNLSAEFLMIPLIIVAWSAALPIIYSIVLTNVPKSHFGSMTGFILLISEFTYLLGTFFSGYIFTVLNYKVAFFISMLSLTLFSVVTVVFLTDIRKPTNKKKIE
ncbi:MAG: MFS transporter [Bacteroidetes bacterium]|nr:MAG: MFS transporter [Bacteroidota bacterium]